MITNSKGRGGFSIPMLLIGRRRWQVNGAIRISQPKADTQTKNPKWQDRILTEVEATVRGGLSVYWAGNLGELGGIGGLGIAQIYGHIQLSSLCDCGWGSANICIRGVPWFPRILPGIWKSHCQCFILLVCFIFCMFITALKTKHRFSLQRYEDRSASLMFPRWHTNDELWEHYKFAIKL